MKRDQSATMKRFHERQPLPVQRKKAVLVECDRFRCVAYQDAAGVWRGYFSGEVLLGEIKVLKA
jgi:hypothetical protein